MRSICLKIFFPAMYGLNITNSSWAKRKIFASLRAMWHLIKTWTVDLPIWSRSFIKNLIFFNVGIHHTSNIGMLGKSFWHTNQFLNSHYRFFPLLQSTDFPHFLVNKEIMKISIKLMLIFKKWKVDLNRSIIKDNRGTKCCKILSGLLAYSLGFLLRDIYLFTGDAHSHAKYFEENSFY